MAQYLAPPPHGWSRCRVSGCLAARTQAWRTTAVLARGGSDRPDRRSTRRLLRMMGAPFRHSVNKTLYALRNSVKEETYGAIKELHDADINTVMVTGKFFYVIKI